MFNWIKVRSVTGHVVDVICLSRKKKVLSHLLCNKMHHYPENDFMITKTIFYQSSEEIMQNFNVLLVEVMIVVSIDLWNDMQPHFMTDLRNIFLFFSYLRMFHMNNIYQKFQDHLLNKWRFFIHHWISISSTWSYGLIVPLQSTLILNSICVI